MAAASKVKARPTQSFVKTITWCRKHPSLTLLEILWRWIFGIPAMLLLYRFGSQMLAALPWRETGILQLSVNQMLTDPLRGSATIAAFVVLLMPPVLHSATWLAPLLIAMWSVLSAVGRTVVLRRMDPSLHARPMTLLVLNLLRLVPLLLGAAAWWFVLSAVAQQTILAPALSGGEPQMMVYIGTAIALTLGLFMLWAVVGWVFTAAPLLAMKQDLGAVAAMRASLRLGPSRAGLIEINLVMGIVKIALLVLFMAFSSTPLPFQSVITDAFLLWWTFAVFALYVLLSDFFHVARLAGYLHLWQQSDANFIDSE